MKGNFKMFFIIAIFNLVFVSLHIDAFNNVSMRACAFALNPFSTFRPSLISKGHDKKIVREIENFSNREKAQFVQALKYAKCFVAGGIALSGAGLSYYFNSPIGFFLVPMACLPTAAYLSQLNDFKMVYV